MKGRLPIEISTVPSEEVERLFSQMLDGLADALADQFIAQARLEVARNLGVEEDSLGGQPEKIDLSKMMGML